MNGIPALVLFDLGDTRSFVSLVLTGGSTMSMESWIEVEIVDDRPMRVLKVHQGCTLELFS